MGLWGASHGLSPWGRPWRLSGKDCCLCQRHKLDPWSGKILYSEQLSPGTTATESVPWGAGPLSNWRHEAPGWPNAKEVNKRIKKKGSSREEVGRGSRERGGA